MTKFLLFLKIVCLNIHIQVWKVSVIYRFSLSLLFHITTLDIFWKMHKINSRNQQQCVFRIISQIQTFNLLTFILIYIIGVILIIPIKELTCI